MLMNEPAGNQPGFPARRNLSFEMVGRTSIFPKVGFFFAFF
ncbi:hypothetical protein [Paenibacillus helianthi]|nr:hypothetical protein [Paenibacillus helianthi]